MKEIAKKVVQTKSSSYIDKKEQSVQNIIEKAMKVNQMNYKDKGNTVV